MNTSWKPARRTLLVIGVLVALMCSGLGLALAQNYSGNPTYGSRNLAPGFMPDPVVVSLTAGGQINTRTTGPSPACGHVASNPDFRVTWAGGSALHFTATSGSDVTLLINGPAGGWRCNDDTRGTNPALSFPGAPAGQYDIWVGTYNAGNQPAVLKISERGQMW